MAKKIVAPVKLPVVNCIGCIYSENSDGVVHWCSKICMPRPYKSHKNCIYKILKDE